MTPTCDVGPGRAEACRLPTMTPPAPASCTCPSSTPHPPLVPPPPPLSPSLSCPPAMGTVPPPPLPPLCVWHPPPRLRAHGGRVGGHDAAHRVARGGHTRWRSDSGRLVGVGSVGERGGGERGWHERGWGKDGGNGAACAAPVARRPCHDCRRRYHRRHCRSRHCRRETTAAALPRVCGTRELLL